MKCVWSAFISILPIWMRQYVDEYGRDSLLELRLRLGLPPELVTMHETIFLERPVSSDDLVFCINIASKYSPWAVNTTAQGYITLEGGHRIGICGNVTYKGDTLNGISVVSSLCIRVAREFKQISGDLWKQKGSILIIGKPGSGKTTLLRDLIVQKSERGSGEICVIDEKRELFPYYHGASCFRTGKRTDILSGCAKKDGIEIAIRNMGPSVIAVDEITAAEDCAALLHAGWCGVDIIASAHAGSRKDLYARAVYKPIISSKLFDTLIIMHDDKAWSSERMN